MVQVLADLASPHSGTSSHTEVWQQSSQNHATTPGVTSNERAPESGQKQPKPFIKKTPRRGWSMTDYQGEGNAAQLHRSVNLSSRPNPIPEDEVISQIVTTRTHIDTSSTPRLDTQPIAQLPARPKLPPPRRSYSVMDYEPIPHGQPRPSGHMTLLDLPSELHYVLYDWLDPIDGVCLGLSHSKLYDIHRRKYGKVPLSSRYSGPNDMEWAWRGAGPLVGRQNSKPATEPAPEKRPELHHLKVKGQVYCRKCGVERCELHRHLKDWMGDNYEYCPVKQVFSKPAGADAKEYCYQSSPKNPQRCGRHGGRASTAMRPSTMVEVAS